MKLLVLAAGYATRLHPLTRTRAKPLLDVAGCPMIEHVLATTRNLPSISGIEVVTNHKFAADFETWAREYQHRHPTSPPITIVNDQSTDDTNKLGAIGDIDHVIRTRKIDDDLLIIGGDNLFREPLDGFLAFAERTGPSVGIYDVGDLEQIKKYNNVSWNAEGRITDFEEKPAVPRSTKTAICLYYYPRQILPLIARYLADRNNPDQPGRLVAWLYKQLPVYVFEIHGVWLDIGSIDSLQQAQSLFAR